MRKVRPLLERFLEKILINEETGCWNWHGSVNKDGYGYFNSTNAHRIAHQLYKGPIPAGLEIDHLCRNHGCVNPDHIEAVTHLVNMQRGKADRAVWDNTGMCKRGHIIEPNNIYTRPRNGERECRQCRSEQNAAKLIGRLLDFDFLLKILNFMGEG